MSPDEFAFLMIAVVSSLITGISVAIAYKQYRATSPTGLDKRVRDLETAQEESKKAHEKLQEQINSGDRALSALEEDIKSMRASIDSMDKTLLRMEGRIDTLYVTRNHNH